MHKVTLKLELDLDFILVAITAPLKDYRLCFFINRQLGTAFERMDELEVFLRAAGGPAYFNRYAYIPENQQTEFYLLANRGEEGFLIPEMNKVDYFLMIRNFIDDEDMEQLLADLNRIPEIIVAAEVDPQKLKSKENLVF